MRRGSIRRLPACLLALALAAAAAPAQFGPIDATGLVPLNDLGAEAYAGELGGLYPGGENARPGVHDAAGLAAAARIQPRDALGQPDPKGRVVMLTTGMSNAKIIGKVFGKLAAKDPLRSQKLTIVNGGHAGKTADLMADPSDSFWQFLATDLADAGVTPAEVQVVWMLNTHKDGGVPFPQHAQQLADDVGAVARLLKAAFPNLQIMYLSSRIYGGHDVNGTSSEPHAYESGFGMKWVIERQISGSPALAFDPDVGPVVAPWLAWGPYLWADGNIERSDGLTWTAGDFAKDGLHPNHVGADKAATELLDFLHTDATAQSWYLRVADELCLRQAEVLKYGVATGADPRHAPRLGTNMLPTAGAETPLRLYVRGAPSGAPGWFLLGDPLPAGLAVKGGTVWIDPQTLRIEAVTTNTSGQAWMDLGQVPETDAATCGALLHAQYVSWTPEGLDFSRAVRLRIGH